jgi:hypothetical protein
MYIWLGGKSVGGGLVSKLFLIYFNFFLFIKYIFEKSKPTKNTPP